MSDPSTPSGGWTTHEEEGFFALVGPVFERWTEDGLALAFVAEDKHHNRRGVVQGGMLVTLADRTMGFSAHRAFDNAPVATVQLDTHFVSAARLGEFIEARAEIARLTKSLAFMEGRVMAGDRLIMTAKGLWKRLKDDGSMRA